MMSTKAVLATLVVATSARAATYYVAPGGADSNDGSMAAPFASIQKAANVVQPGDDVIVEDGTYGDPDGDGYVVLANRGGTATAWVTFRSANRWGAVVDGNHDTATHCWVMGPNASFVRIEGFELRDCADAGFHSNSGAHDVWFGGNHVHDIGRVCTDTQYGKTGVFQGSGSYNHVYDGNVIHDIGRLAPGENGCNPTTTYYRNHDHAFYLDSSHIRVENNLVYNNARGWGVQIYGSAPKDDIAIVNNTFAFANPYRDGHITIGPGTSNVVIANNIFYQPRNAVATVDTCSGISNVSFVANLSDVGALQSGPTDCGFAAMANQLATDPQLVAPAMFDFHLAAGSPAIDTGSDTGPPPATDFAGTARPQGNGYDIGAYEVATAAGSDAGVADGVPGSDGEPADAPGAATHHGGGCDAGGEPGALLVLLVAGALASGRWSSSRS